MLWKSGPRSPCNLRILRGLSLRKVLWQVALGCLVLYLFYLFFEAMFWGGDDPAFLRQPIGTVVGGLVPGAGIEPARPMRVEGF